MKHTPTVTFTLLAIPSSNNLMAANICGGTLKQVCTCHRREWSTEPYAFWRLTKSGTPPCRPSSCTSRTTNTITVVELCWWPTLFSQQQFIRLLVITETHCDNLEDDLVRTRHERDATTFAALCPTLRLMHHLYHGVLPLLWDLLSMPNELYHTAELSKDNIVLVESGLKQRG